MHDQSMEAPPHNSSYADDMYFDRRPPAERRSGGGGTPYYTRARSESAGLGAALKKYPLIALLPVVVFVAAGITLGLRKPPTYTATTQLNVGAADINSQATPGYVQAEQTLAQAYSREVTSQYVYNPASQSLGVSPATVAGRLSSSAVPNSPTFTINATGPTQASAVHLAAVATQALQHKINQLDQGENGSTYLLNEFRAAQAHADQLSAHSGSLQARKSSGTGNISPKTLQSAKVAAQVAQVQAQALATQYTGANTLSKGAIIDVLNPATSATSNRMSITERYALVGAAAGLVMGCALALLVYSARRRWTDRRL
jgi:ribosomal protein S8E